MKIKRKTILVLLAGVLAGMVVYAPFHIPLAGKMSVDLGYGFLFDPPGKGPIQGTLNMRQLAMQAGGACAIGAVLLLISRK